MKDMIITGTGDSRKLKSSIPEGTTWEEALAMLRSGTFPVDFGSTYVGISQHGTPLNKDTFLPDALVTLFERFHGVQFTDPTPAAEMEEFLEYLDTSMVAAKRVVTPLDMDDVTDTCYIVYNLTGEYVPTPLPTGVTASGHAVLFVMTGMSGSTVTYVAQIFITADGIWYRIREGSGTFGSWTKLIVLSDTATTSANGLMSSTDKNLLDNWAVVARGTSTETNIDNIIKPGSYWLSSTQTSGWPSQEPSNRNAHMDVFTSGGGKVQRMVMYSGTGDNHEYIRMYINSQWYPWQRVVTGTAWDLGLAPQIAANTDLNNMKTPGSYSSPGTITSTLTNAPPVASNAFVMQVMVGHLANTYVQLAIDVMGNAMYLRYFNTSSWGSWYKYTGTAV